MNKDKLNKKIKLWEKIREKGRRNFYIKFGVIGWGIPVSLIPPVLLAFLNSKGDFFEFEAFKIDVFLQILPFTLPINLIIGYFLAVYIWKKRENNYKNIINQ